MTLCQSVELTDLEVLNIPQDRPLNFRDRTMHYLPNHKNLLQKRLDDVEKFSQIQKFIINEGKTHTVIFNTATSKDFYPRIANLNGVIYNNFEVFKLLGIEITTDKQKGMNFNSYINKCIQKAYRNLWILRRLAELGISTEKLLLTYCLRIRIMVEQNVPLWMFSLSK